MKKNSHICISFLLAVLLLAGIFPDVTALEADTQNNDHLIGEAAFCTEDETSSASEYGTAAVQTVHLTGEVDYAYIWSVLDSVNAQRAAAGVSPLTMNNAAMQAAIQRAAEIAIYFDHTRPNGSSWSETWNWFFTAGENIAAGQINPSNVMTSWMNSSGHRANILNSSFKSIGIGCFYHNGRYYWVQLFDGVQINNVTRTATRETLYDRAVQTLPDKLSLAIGDGSSIITSTSVTASSHGAVTLGGDIRNVNTGTGSSNFRAKLSPADYTYTSGNPDVAQVRNGIVEVINTGNATITASIGGVSNTVTFQVRTSVTNGWLNLANGKYYFANGRRTMGFAVVDGAQRYFDPSDYGKMLIGWRTIEGYQRHFDENGIMSTGWNVIEGKYHYFNQYGVPYAGWHVIDGYLRYFGTGGVCYEGWHVIDGYLRCFGVGGAVYEGWQMIDGTWRLFGTGGAVYTGWQTIDGYLRYFNEQGSTMPGWQTIDGYRRYFNIYGAVMPGWQTIDDKLYYFNDYGAAATGWVTVDGYLRYFDTSGAMAIGWVTVDGFMRYFNEYGIMYANTQAWIEGRLYAFNEYGGFVIIG